MTDAPDSETGVVEEAMNLIIVRHAESTGNAEDRLQGQDDFPLSDRGRRQAALLRARFESEGYQPTHIYSSPLSRTLETARIASAGWDLPITRWDDLMEVAMGVFSSLTWEDIQARFPEMARRFLETNNLDVVEGAEAFERRLERGSRVVDRIMAEHTNDDRVLVFSHGGIMRYQIARILGTNRVWGVSVRNTAMFEFSVDVDCWQSDEQEVVNLSLWRIGRFNDASHLD